MNTIREYNLFDTLTTVTNKLGWCTIKVTLKNEEIYIDSTVSLTAIAILIELKLGIINNVIRKSVLILLKSVTEEYTLMIQYIYWYNSSC